MIYNFLITHNDLDATGCIMALQDKDVELDYVFSTDYSNLKKGAEDLIKVAQEYQSDDNFVRLFIADVCFSQNRDVLLNLASHLDAVVIYDHHMYPDDFFNNLPKNVTFHISDAACGCKLISLFEGCSEKLKELIDLIDVYDRWQMKDPKFMQAFFFNEYFLELQKSQNILKIAKFFKSEEYNTRPSDYEKILEPRLEDIMITKTYLKSNFKLVVNHEYKFTIIKSLKYFNNFLIEEMRDNLQDLVVGYAKGYYKIRVRENTFTDDELNCFRRKVTGTVNIGHQCAFSVKTTEDTEEVLERIIHAYKEMLDKRTERWYK